MCGASVGLCVVLVGFVMFTVMWFFPSDAASRRALQLALQQLAESQPEATAKNLLQSLQSSGIGGKAGAPRCGISCSVGSWFELLVVVLVFRTTLLLLLARGVGNI